MLDRKTMMREPWVFDPRTLQVATEGKIPVAKVTKWAAVHCWQANGKLIAAAPKLLDVCERLQEEAAKRGEQITLLDEAIALATGKLDSV